MLVGAAILAAAIFVPVALLTSGTSERSRATFNVVSCDPAEDQVTLGLTSRGPVQKDEVAVFLFNRTADAREATLDPLDEAGGPWTTGEVLVVSRVGGPTPAWEAPLASPGGLQEGDRYEAYVHHNPSKTTLARLPFTC